MLRVLRGEPLEIVARERRVTAGDLSGWRDAFLEAGAAGLKSRPRDDRDARIAQLRAKLGEVTMDKELLQEKIADGGGPPFGATEVETMSAVPSISAQRRYGLARVCRVGRCPGRDLSSSPVGRPAHASTSAAGAAWPDAGWRPGDGDPHRARRQPVPW